MDKLFDWITQNRFSHKLQKKPIKENDSKKQSKQKIHAFQKSKGRDNSNKTC
jgi:hypothetical protein